MDKFVINGGKKLSGTIEVRGAKNAALKLFAASLLTKKPVKLTNVPEVEDVSRMSELLRNLGAKVDHVRNGEYRIVADNINSTSINPEIAKKLRASIVLAGPLLARMGKVVFPHPGGCIIGERPIDVFIDGFKAMGAKLSSNDGIYEISAKKLKGDRFVFHNVSVTGTETMMMTAVLAKGTTILKNCACEPEIESLADFLNLCGAKIKGAGAHTIIVSGVSSLTGGTCRVIPDRIEAGSFALLAAASGSSIKIKNCDPSHLDSLLNFLKKAGVNLKTSSSGIEVNPSDKIRAFGIKTREYPGFPTDLQAPLCVLLTQSEGQALVHETIYEGRLAWTEELKRMGADILNLDPHRVEIRGPTKLRGREIESPDLRAGMAYVVAALCAEGESIINNVYQIDRGYEKIEERLQKIGADIKRI
ncbi:MAG: UDP-N-acetylglucosamine 1-carboxyvinyltransferase [bacterium]|nr:UDP-N-acetylglucosamine 1-carboxyvinyltransferase [bacterium]